MLAGDGGLVEEFAAVQRRIVGREGAAIDAGLDAGFVVADIIHETECRFRLACGVQHAQRGAAVLALVTVPS